MASCFGVYAQRSASNECMNVFCKGHTELWLPVVEVTAKNSVKLRPYLTFNGNCAEAIELYKKAFQTEAMQVMRFSDMPEMPGFDIPEDFKDKILQAGIKFGADYIRLPLWLWPRSFFK